MARVRMTGYTDRMSVVQGGTIDVMLSVENATEARIDLVRLVHGDEHPDGPGFVERDVASELSRTIPVRRQFSNVGSYAEVRAPSARFDGQSPFTIVSYVLPTTARKGRQVLLGAWSVRDSVGYALGIDAQGHPSFWVGDGREVDEVRGDFELLDRRWYCIAVSYDPDRGEVLLVHRDVTNSYNGITGPASPLPTGGAVRQSVRVRAAPPTTMFRWAAATDTAPIRGQFATQLFNGKIDRTAVLSGASSSEQIESIIEHGGIDPRADRVIAAWDTTVGLDGGLNGPAVGNRIVDAGPSGLHADGVNKPIRAMTGWNWSGHAQDWRLAPGEYGGIAFHDDAVTDSGWEPTLTFDVPAELPSGVYAVRVRAEEVEDHIPFVVTPRRPSAPIVFVVPTFSYLAYANEALAFTVPVGQAIGGHPAVIDAQLVELFELGEFGKSTYDLHNDGEGVCYSSCHRPIKNFRPRHRSATIGSTWQFGRDLSLIAWLDAKGYDFDVIADHDVHRDGVAALRPYRTVLTGSHPEYHSERSLDAYEGYVSGGGRLMYMGGNGFYWVVSFDDDADPAVMEVRKGEAGMRAWQCRPGEQHHATSGERGGLWRLRGRPPQKLTGVGFTTQGFDECTYYDRMPDSFHRSVAWIFDGIGDDERIGDFGLALGGAAGLEVERYDLALGTPPHTMLLASSAPFSDNYAFVHEDILFNHAGLSGSQEYRVRADMTYFTAPNGGGVFSTGSIAWISALPSAGFDNNVSRVTANVLDAFARAGDLPGKQWAEDEKLWR